MSILIKGMEMPNSCKCILDKMLHKGAMTQAEHDKILRNLPRWIPCSEGLPKTEDTVFVTYADGTRGLSIYSLLSEKFIGYLTVVAWMPLPEPYMRGEENGNNGNENPYYF